MAKDAVEYPPNCQPIKNTVAKSDLVKRLKDLCDALQDLETNEDCGQPTRYRDLLIHLCDKAFMDNSSREVQVYLGLCIAHLFRIFQSDVPIGLNDPSKLREVLLFLIRALKGLDSPEAPLFKRHYALMEVLIDAKVFMLATELPVNDASTVVRSLIKACCEIVNGKEWIALISEKKQSAVPSASFDLVDSDEMDEDDDRLQRLQLTLVGAISSLLGRIEVTRPVLDALLYFIVNPQKSNQRQSYEMAKRIINSAQMSLDIAVQPLLMNSLLAGVLPDEFTLVGTNRSKLHEVMFELHQIAPELVKPAIPQVAKGMMSEDLDRRVLSTKLIGMLIVNPTSQLADNDQDTWNRFLRRFRDQDKQVRLFCLGLASRLLVNHINLRGSVAEMVMKSLEDLEGEVRSAAVAAVTDAARKRLEAVSEQLLSKCSARLRDVKEEVRLDALLRLTQLHRHVLFLGESSPSDAQVVAPIARDALAIYTAKHGFLEGKVCLERYLASHIIPFDMEPKKRVKFLCSLFEGLTFAAIEGFRLIVSRLGVYRRFCVEMLDAIAKTEQLGEEAVKNLCNDRIDRIATVHPNVVHVSASLRKLVNQLCVDTRSFEIMKSLLSSDYVIVEAKAKGVELFHRAEVQKLTTKEQQRTIRHFVERVTPLLMDRDSVNELLKIVKRSGGDVMCGKLQAEEKYIKLLRLVQILGKRETMAHLFTHESSMEVLIEMLRHENAKTVECAINVLLNTVPIIGSKLSGMKFFEDLKNTVTDVIHLQDYQMSQSCKLAVRLLNQILPKGDRKGPCSVFADIAKTMSVRLDISQRGCVNAVRVLGELLRLHPSDHREMIYGLAADSLVSNLVLSDKCSENANEKEVEHHDNAALSKQPLSAFALAKVYAMKLLARLTTHLEIDDKKTLMLVQKSLRLFAQIVETRCELHPDVAISDLEKAAMRSVAGTCLVKICYSSSNRMEMRPEQFLVLSTLLLDDSSFVREHFLTSISKVLLQVRLPVEFFGLIAVGTLKRAVNEKEEEQVHRYVEKCKTIMRDAMRKIFMAMQSTSTAKFFAGMYFRPEFCIVYAVYVLAHHSGCPSHDDVESVAALQEALWTVLEQLTSLRSEFSVDLELVCRIFEHLKRLEDNMEPSSNPDEGGYSIERIQMANKLMWGLADLGLLMVCYRCKYQTKNEARDVRCSKRMFKACKKQVVKIMAPEELLDDENKRKGRLPPKNRKFGAAVNGTTTMAGGTSKLVGRNIRHHKREIVDDMELESDSEDEKRENGVHHNDEEDQAEVLPVSKRGRKKILSNSHDSEDTVMKKENKPEVSKAETSRNSSQDSQTTRSGRGRPPKVNIQTHSVTSEPSTSKATSFESPRLKRSNKSLEDLGISPIQGTFMRPSRSNAKLDNKTNGRGLTTSTPIVTTDFRRKQLKRTAVGTPDVDATEKSTPAKKIRSTSLEKTTEMKRPSAGYTSPSKPVKGSQRTLRGAQRTLRGSQTSQKADIEKSPKKSDKPSTSGSRVKHEKEVTKSIGKESEEKKVKVVQKKVARKSDKSKAEPVERTAPVRRSSQRLNAADGVDTQKHTKPVTSPKKSKSSEKAESPKKRKVAVPETAPTDSIASRRSSQKVNNTVDDTNKKKRGRKLNDSQENEQQSKRKAPSKTETPVEGSKRRIKRPATASPSASKVQAAASPKKSKGKVAESPKKLVRPKRNSK